MATLAVTYSLTNGTTADASQVSQNLTDIVNYVNNRNDGSATWDSLRVTASSSTAAAGIINNGSSTGAILTLNDNGTTMHNFTDGGAVVLNENGNDADIRFEGDTEAELFHADASADAIGIGTASPATRVEIVKTSAGASTTPLMLRNSSASASTEVVLDMNPSVSDPATRSALMVATNNGSGVIGFQVKLSNAGAPAQVLHITGPGVATIAAQSSCRVFRATSDQSITANTITKIEFNSETYDNQGEFDSATNYNFTATVAGKYMVNAFATLTATSANDNVNIYIYKNGSAHSDVVQADAKGGTFSIGICDVVTLAVNDTIDIRIRNATNNDSVDSGTTVTWLNIHKVC